jgi:hypothetical protein
VGPDPGSSFLVALPVIWLVLLAATAPAPPPPVPHVLDEKERAALEQTDVVRLSLPTESDAAAWAAPGLRVQLGYGYGRVAGSGPAWSWRGHNVLLRPSVRLDEHWGLGVAMLYGTAPGGVRWSVTAEPTFFLWRQTAVTVGLGYGGLSVSDPFAFGGRSPGPDEVVSRDLADDETLHSCTGSAVSGLLRIEHLFVAGPLFASGPMVQGQGQWTRCQATFGRTNAETGRPVVLTQWWRQSSLMFGWWLAWR